jgi:hypothetical protein
MSYLLIFSHFKLYNIFSGYFQYEKTNMSQKNSQPALILKNTPYRSKTGYVATLPKHRDHFWSTVRPRLSYNNSRFIHQSSLIASKTPRSEAGRNLTRYIMNFSY